MKRGGTFLNGKGAFTNKEKKILLTVVNNYQLKRLEENVFSIDANAFMIIENTFNVLGWDFPKEKCIDAPDAGMIDLIVEITIQHIH